MSALRPVLNPQSVAVVGASESVSGSTRLLGATATDASGVLVAPELVALTLASLGHGIAAVMGDAGHAVAQLLELRAQTLQSPIRQLAHVRTPVVSTPSSSPYPAGAPRHRGGRGRNGSRQQPLRGPGHCFGRGLSERLGRVDREVDRHPRLPPARRRNRQVAEAGGSAARASDWAGGRGPRRSRRRAAACRCPHQCHFSAGVLCRRGSLRRPGRSRRRVPPGCARCRGCSM